VFHGADVFQGLRLINQASTSAFSAEVHSRPNTSLQLRRNHFSVLAMSVKRLALAAGASGVMALRVLACVPSAVGCWVWQVLQRHSLPWVASKKSWPRTAWGAWPDAWA
jgi:hypothetical protein